MTDDDGVRVSALWSAFAVAWILSAAWVEVGFWIGEQTRDHRPAPAVAPA